MHETRTLRLRLAVQQADGGDLGLGHADASLFTGAPYADSPEGWWMEYGGALDVTSGVVHFPQEVELPACRFRCHHCRTENHR
jgi:hypothetical protein